MMKRPGALAECRAMGSALGNRARRRSDAVGSPIQGVIRRLRSSTLEFVLGDYGRPAANADFLTCHPGAAPGCVSIISDAAMRDACMLKLAMRRRAGFAAVADRA